MHENVCLGQLTFNMYVQKFNSSGQDSLKSQNRSGAIKKYFLGGDVQQHKKHSWNY